MKTVTNNDIIAWIDRYLMDPRLEPEERLRKRWAWIWMVVTFTGFLIISSSLIIIFKLWPLFWFAGALASCYLVAFPFYRRLKRFDLVLNIAFTLIIIIAFFMLLKLGGINTSVGALFIGLNAAMGSLFAGNLRWTIGMFILYSITIIIAAFLQPYLTAPAYISTSVNKILYTVQALWINACLLFLVALYMKDKSRFEKAEAERLKKLDESKTQLYTNVSHEFRTPLTVIQGIAEQMEQHSGRWLQNGPEKIKMQSQVLLHLVNQMLDIAKIESKAMYLSPIHGDIKKYIHYIIGSFQSLAEKNKIDLKTNMNDAPVFTDYDPEKLMQILANLLSNAIKFTPPGGKIVVDVLNEFEKREEIIEIHVTDSGRGIPSEALTRIFDRFYQVPNSNAQIPGTGLGLALTRELVKLMKGKIRVSSEVGKGSEFIVTLPVKNEAPTKEDHGISLIKPETIHATVPEQKSVKEYKIRPALSGNKPILLIVEDNQDVVEYLVATLEEYYMIELASNGKTGLDKAIEIIPDIILSDVMMPQMDGFEMLVHLRNDIRTDHIPVVVLTARGDIRSKISGLEIGADHYLVKPFNEKELFLRLNNLLEARKKMQNKLSIVPFAPPKSGSSYRQEMKFLSQINALLEAQLSNEDFGIVDLCSALNMSRPQLYRKFTALTDKSIGQYIKSYRLHKAKEMIELQGKNVTEAAFESGFKNLSHFSTSFREEFGISPSELR